MRIQKGENPNHPQPGATIKVAPIIKKRAIEDIKRFLADNPRDFCLFTLGINVAYRANELLSLKAGQVRSLKVGDSLSVYQSKTDKYRRVTLNVNAVEAIQGLLESYNYGNDDYLFHSQRGEVLKVPSVTRKVKAWCDRAGLKGNYGSHTLRKTWGYWQYKNNAPLPLLVKAFEHTTQEQTLEYLCIQPPEIAQIYELAL